MRYLKPASAEAAKGSDCGIQSVRFRAFSHPSPFACRMRRKHQLYSIFHLHPAWKLLSVRGSFDIYR
nr:MAG TPA: hypothetical protein [Caudoviricetes sp.]